MKFYLNAISILVVTILLVSCNQGVSTSDVSGKSGLLSRFAMSDDKLYVLAGSSMQLFDIQNPEVPAIWNKVHVGFNIETLRAHENYLYIGAADGVYIFDNSNPEFPHMISRFSHVVACDPVVIQGDYACVTLRNTGNCAGVFNQLEVLDVSDPHNPELLKVYPMQGPYGLGVDDDRLFICDGMAGLKILDISDPLDIQSVSSESEIMCSDVITNDGTLVVSDDSGLIQYDCRVEPMLKLSHIEVTVGAEL